MSRIRIIGVVSALVFWLLGVQGFALDLPCDGDCAEVGLDSGESLFVNYENDWLSMQKDLECIKTGVGNLAADPCTAQIFMSPVEVNSGPIPILSRWWIIVAMVSFAFIGFFYLYWESLTSIDDILPEHFDKRTQDMAKALADVVRDHSPGR